MDKKFRIPIAFCMAAVWIFFINCCAGIFFETNDDRLISEIFSGAMTGTPEAHAYYVDYILGFLLSLLYRMTTEVPWYGGMLVLFQFLCWFFIANAFLACCKSRRDCFRAFVCCILLYAAGFYVIAGIQFTSTAALLAITGYLCFLLYPEGKGRYVLFFLFEFLAFLLRSNAMLMIQPMGFLTLSGFYFAERRLYRFHAFSGKEWVKNCAPLLRAAALVLIVLLMGKGSHFVFHGGPGWKEYEKINEAVTAITDYADIPEYEQVRSVLEKYNVTEKQYAAFGVYTMIEQNLSGDCLLEIAEVARNQEAKPGAAQICRRFLEGYTIGENSGELNPLLVAGWAVLLVFLFIERRFPLLFPLAGLFLGRSAMWLFLLYGDRTPPRVMVPLYLGEIALLLCLLFLAGGSKVALRNKLGKYAFLKRNLPVVLVLLLLPFGAKALKTQYRSFSAAHAVEAVYFSGMRDVVSYCNAHPEKRFFIDASSLIYYRGSAFETEIYGRRNGVITGCWYSGAPGLCEYTEDYFADCSEIYLIASADMEMQYGRVLSYLEERLGTDAYLDDKFVASNGGEYLIYGLQGAHHAETEGCDWTTDTRVSAAVYTDEKGSCHITDGHCTNWSDADGDRVCDLCGNPVYRELSAGNGEQGSGEQGAELRRIRFWML